MGTRGRQSTVTAGETYGIYKVLEQVESKEGSTSLFWKVKCILCRTETVRASQQVTKFNVKCMCQPQSDELKKAKTEYRDYTTMTDGISYDY